MPRGKATVANADLLAAALEGLEAQKRRIEEQISQVQAMLGHRRGRKPAAEPAEKPARKRIAAAQKRRWAEFRKKAAAEGK